MSAIVAGEACVKCGEKYYISFGHPKWFDDVIKRGNKPCKIFKRFIALQKSKMCLQCFIDCEAESENI